MKKFYFLVKQYAKKESSAVIGVNSNFSKKDIDNKLPTVPKTKRKHTPHIAFLTSSNTKTTITVLTRSEVSSNITISDTEVSLPPHTIEYGMNPNSTKRWKQIVKPSNKRNNFFMVSLFRCVGIVN